MEYRQVGHSGLSVSALGLGTKTWGLTHSKEQAVDLLDSFIEAGGSLVDNSPAYAESTAEECLGYALRDLNLSSGAARDRIVISTAAGVFPQRPLGQRVDCSRRALLSQLDRTLTNLGVDYVDVFSVDYWDEHTPVAEVADTLAAAMRSGKCRYVGVRGYRGWQLAATQLTIRAAGIGADLVSAQSEYNLLSRSAEVELLPAAAHLGIGMFAGSALAQGILTGKYRGGSVPAARADARTAEVQGLIDDRSATITEALVTAAAGLGIEPAVAALAWTLGRSGVASALIGPRTPGQLADLLAVCDLQLPGPIVAALDEISA